MGHWHISVRGVGIHHNQDEPNDADKMAKKFVEDLNKAGHTVLSATITHGGEEDL